MVDPYGRVIDYLRVSVTDRCNFRCVYCMPEDGFPAIPKAENLQFEELVRITRIFAGLGLRKVRLTGGEPLLRKDLPELVAAISDVVEDLSCTTNGHLLASMAAPLKRAGLNRVNVSLDTLKPDRFQEIARRGSLDVVLEGMREAQRVGLDPIKINCVSMRGVNSDDAADFAALTLEKPLHVRFIELMPMRWNLDEADGFDTFSAHRGQGLLQIKQAAGGMLSDAQMRRLFIPCDETKALIENVHGPLEPAEVATNGPARTYRIPGAAGTVGFISQITNDFCSKCNRLRLTHDGFLRPCLMSDGEVDVRTRLREGASDEDIRSLILHVVEHKPERHYLQEGQRVTGRGMSQIGG